MFTVTEKLICTESPDAACRCLRKLYRGWHYSQMALAPAREWPLRLSSSAQSGMIEPDF